MANARSRKQRVIDNGFKAKLEKAEVEMRSVMDFLEKVQKDNQRLQEENSLLREENYRLKTGKTLTPVDTPPPLVEDDSFPPPGTAPDSKTGQIVNNIKQAVLSTANTKVSREKKEVAERGDVLIAYFYIGPRKREIYGYSIINHEILNDHPTILNAIDNADNIQLYLGRSNDEQTLKGIKTYAFVIKSNATVQFPMGDVGAGDIVLWIRSDNPLDQIKKQLSRLFSSKILSQVDVCSGIDREKCDLVDAGVKFISKSIKEQFDHINIKQHGPPIHKTVKTRQTPVPSKVITDLTYEEYKTFIPVPKYPLLADKPRRTDHRWIFHDYLMEGKDLTINVDYNVSGQGLVEDGIPIAAFNPKSNPRHIVNPYAVTKNQRLYAGVNLKDTYMYILKMVDHFHQILVLSFSSQRITDEDLHTFYGRDIGIQEHISGPTPMLTDLMHHMWDVRQGFYLIDQICYVVDSLLQLDINNPFDERLGNVLKTNSEFLKFVELMRAGKDRSESQSNTYADSREFRYYKSLQRAKNTLEDYAPEASPLREHMTDNEVDILFASIPSCALRNYWEIAKLCGLEKQFAYMEPVVTVSSKDRLVHKYEQLTGQRSLTPEERDWGATRIDGDIIELGPNRVIAEFRQIVYQTYLEVLDEVLAGYGKNVPLDTKGWFMLWEKEDDTKWYNHRINQFVLVDIVDQGAKWQARPLRLKLLQLVNAQLFKRVSLRLEERYRLIKEEHKNRPVSRNPGTPGSKEFFIWDDIAKFIMSQKKTRLAEHWINVIQGLLPKTDPEELNENYVIHSLSDLDWMILQRLEDDAWYKLNSSDTY
jgi:hypothetical protein